MDANAKEICEQAKRAFGRRAAVDSLREEIAWNFDPALATFFSARFEGEDFAAHIFEATGALNARDFSGSLQSLLRPSGQSWFRSTSEREEEIGVPAHQFFDWHSGVTRRLLNEQKAMFWRALPMNDRNMAMFGEAPMSIESRHDHDDPGLFCRAYHPSEVAFSENQYGEADKIWRKIKMTARQICQKFEADADATIHPEVKRCMEPGGGDPEQEFCVLHCIMPASDYAYIYRKPLKNRPWVSIYVDETNEHVMREKPARYNPYIVSRWQMVPGIPDGFSPPAMYALPINRRLQQMYLSVLENAQKQADPPHVAVASAILGGEINLVNGGTTYIDTEWSDRASVKDALAPLEIGGDMRVAYEAVRDARLTMASAWMIDKLTMNAEQPETAYAASLQFQEFIRNALPIIEPLENEMNTRLLDKVVEIGMLEGAYGPPEAMLEIMPDGLGGADITYEFENPLRDAIRREKATAYGQAIEIVSMGMGVDPRVTAVIDLPTAATDALSTLRQSDWITDEDARSERLAAMESQMDEQSGLASMEQGARAAKDVGAAIGAAGPALAEMGVA